ncbi:TetR/AcrR family transcriptional regulator [Caulobacter sp. Root343]|uniref:TetR/AcrR family transcriptional regulator n=1 Tax=Caulobacter sp. Root343 TaxID=1736520 RepID=UPI0009E7DCFB|nr:TetR/AcrR family transcriptional regulator [Caulobacter sp. Root343]
MSLATRPTVKPGRPTMSQAAALGDHIVAVARNHFFANGYGSTTMDNIAMDAGISKTTLYRRYKTKADLFTAFLLDQNLRWSAHNPHLNAPASKDLRKALVDRVEAFMLAGLTEASVNLARLIYAESGRFPELAQIFHDNSFASAVNIIATDLAIAAGHDQAVEEFVPAASLLQDIIGGYAYRLILQGRADKISTAEIRSWAEQTVAVFLDGYVPPRA